jgi:hypothetical protein
MKIELAADPRGNPVSANTRAADQVNVCCCVLLPEETLHL